MKWHIWHGDSVILCLGLNLDNSWTDTICMSVEINNFVGFEHGSEDSESAVGSFSPRIFSLLIQIASIVNPFWAIPLSI